MQQLALGRPEWGPALVAARQTEGERARGGGEVDGGAEQVARGGGEVGGAAAVGEAVLQLHEAKHLVDASACLDANVDGATDGYELVSFRLVPRTREEEWSKVMAKHGLLTEREREGWKASGGKARFSSLEFRFDVRRALKDAALVMRAIRGVYLHALTPKANDHPRPGNAPDGRISNSSFV